MCTRRRFAWRLPRAAAPGRYDRLAYSRTVPMSYAKWWLGLAGIGGVSASATKAGDRIKTDRRDALMLAKLHRAGELTPIWIPDAAHEAMRDLVRARATA